MWNDLYKKSKKMLAGNIQHTSTAEATSSPPLIEIASVPDASAKKSVQPILPSLSSIRSFIRNALIKNVVAISSPYFLEVMGESFPFAEGPGLWALLGAAVGAWERLWVMCALTRWPAARAEHNESSPARTPAATILASCCAFLPGVVGWAPRTPRRSSMAA